MKALFCALFLVFLLLGCAHTSTVPISATVAPSPSDESREGRPQSDAAPAALDDAAGAKPIALPSQPGAEGEQTVSKGGDENVPIVFGGLGPPTEADGEEALIADPLAPWNRLMFQFNDKFYFWVLKPVSRGYKAVVPRVARTGVKNFFSNVTTPVRLVSCILQGKGTRAVIEFNRFVVNTTFGILGFTDFAAGHGVPPPDKEDLGQTFGAYGIGHGFFIVWPLLGPSTLRDSVGMVGDWFLDPVGYVPPVPEAGVGIVSYKTVNTTSFRLGDYESFKEAAIDPYLALRNAYVQYRKQMVKE